MDFSTAPIADLETDDLSVCEENRSNHVEDAINCVLKRSLSDPFDIAVGLNLEVSLERLIWTFDNDISANLTSTDANNKVEKEQDAQAKRSNVDAIKRFWRISQAPINNPMETYPLENIPSLLTSDDIHMADADSVSEATSKDLPLSKLGWSSSNARRVADKSDEDTVATNSINPFSTSESSSLSSSPVTGQGDDSLALRVSAFGLSNYELGPNQEWTNHRASAEAMAIETEAGAMTVGADEEEAEFGLLDASLRNAEMQATLEAFKARHPTLPLVRTDAWRQDLCKLTPLLLQRYYDELMTETGRVSEQLVASLAEREELILFREVEDDFVVLHNAIQVRRRRAAEAVLARTTQSVLFHKKTTQLKTVHRLPGDPRTGSLIELVDLPPDLVGNGIGSSAENMFHAEPKRALGETRKSSNSSRSNIQTSSRCPRGHPVGEPINLPRFTSALSRLGSRLGYRSASTSQLVGGRDMRTLNYQQLYEADTAIVGGNSAEMQQFMQAARSRITAGGRKNAVILPSPYMPWPLGRPECSQVLRLAIRLPADDLSIWLPPRLHIINRIMQAALQENQSISSLFEELSTFDPSMPPEPSSKLEDYGFDAPDARLSASMLAFSRPEKTHSRKNVTFDWRGTKELFNNGAVKSMTPTSATQSDTVF